MESSVGFGKFYKRSNIVDVSSEKEFIKSLSEEATISIVTDFDITQLIKISNSITILGNHHTLTVQESGSLYFQNTKNIFVLDIAFNGQGSDWDNNLDLLTFDNVLNVVLDGCVFADGADECVCFKNGCDNITISNSVFTYTKPPKGTKGGIDHNFALLVGKNSDDKPTSGKHHLTLYKVTFKGNIRRCPRVRHSLVHMIECSFESTSIYTVGPENSELVFVDCQYKSRNYDSPLFIRKFGDYKCIVLSSGKAIYKNPKFSTFNLPEYL